MGSHFITGKWPRNEQIIAIGPETKYDSAGEGQQQINAMLYILYQNSPPYRNPQRKWVRDDRGIRGLGKSGDDII
jgi:hypothetical protein